MVIIVNNKALYFKSKEPIKYNNYPANDLSSVYTHYNSETGKNEPTKNELPKEDNINGKSV